MSRLTTVATFDLAAKAEVAKNVLDEAGIPAVIADAEVVAMDWLMAVAVGGIKVQVREEDAERAAAVLDERFGAGAGLAAEGLDEDELTRQALAAGEPEEDDVELAPASVTADEQSAGVAGPERNEYARRLFLTAMFSIVFPPLWFYAFYLMLNAAFGPGLLSDRGRRQLRIGAVMVLVPLLFWMLILSAVGGLSDWFPAGW
ncbi:MAG TPA: DUF2007 domain-containing protein [Fimbriiglobus sp.]|nr:DUF2007 domain-containing protein [Fimbriiglobus sp.]